VLLEIGADRVPEFIVFNKIDVDPEVVDELLADYPGSVAVSAITGEGIEHMLAILGDRLRSLTSVAELLIPWARGDVIASVHREGAIVSTREETDGMRIRARLAGPSLGRLAEWVVEPPRNADVNAKGCDE
jgi:GTP-binding protein HflX